MVKKLIADFNKCLQIYKAGRCVNNFANHDSYDLRLSNSLIDIGCKYEKTKSMLIEKLNDPLNFEVVDKEGVSDGHACYFCGNGVTKGDEVFEILYRVPNGFGGLGEKRFFVDEECMADIKKKGQ